MVLNTALKFLISAYLMVYDILEIWVLMTQWGEMGPPWWRNDKWDP